MNKLGKLFTPKMPPKRVKVNVLQFFVSRETHINVTNMLSLWGRTT